MSSVTPLPEGAGPASEQGAELPHSIEAEQALLGALLVNNEVYDRVASVVNEAHFFDPVHGRIFTTIARRP